MNNSPSLWNRVPLRKLWAPNARPKNELESVQALRALAAASVIMYHLDLFHKGGYGVDIFFVMSGFIIAFICAQTTDHFMAKRLIRIIPLYWLGTLGVFAIAVAAPSVLNSATANVVELIKSMAFVPYEHSNGSVKPLLFLGWSLQYEIFFYMVYGVALRVSKKWASMVAVVMLIAIAFVGGKIPESSTILKFYSNPIILEFAFGVAAFEVWKRYKTQLARIPVVLAAAVALVCYSWILYKTDRVSRPDRLLQVGLPSVMIFLSFLTVERRVRFPKWVLLVGDASFSLYLFHPYVLQLVDKKIVSLAVLTPLTFAVAIVSVVICVVFSIACYRLVELPSNKFFRKVFLEGSGTRTVLVAPAVAPTETRSGEPVTSGVNA
jgi:exopolysaccharide production protein ExoZ